MKEDKDDRIHRQKKDDHTTTCIPLRDLSCDLFDFILSHGSRAAATSRQSSQEDIRRGEKQKESTSGEETTASSSHLGSQCSTNISTSTSLTSPTTRRNLLQQTSWFYVQKLEHVKVLRFYVSELHVKNFEKNVHYLQETVETSESSTERYKPPMTSMHNNYFRMQQPPLRYVVLVNASGTSSCMLPSRVANRTTYFVDFRGQTSDGKCFDNFDINMLQELVYNNTPYYSALYIHNLDGQRHHNNNNNSEVDTRHLGLRDDTSCHRQHLEGEYNNKQLTWTDTTTSSTSGSSTSYMARSTSNDRQLLCQQPHAPPWSDHWQHRPGHQHHPEEGQRQEMKG